MKMFLFLLALGYVSSEKLDLSYLPPPGSQHAGGRPEDIQIPFEFPKETYSSTLRPQARDRFNSGDYKPTIGIDRIPPGAQGTSIGTPGSTFSNFQNTQKVPTTTVSYAFTQTTTHPPNEGFETTIGPLAGFPTNDFLNNFPSQESSPNNDGSLNAQSHPGQGPASISQATFNNVPNKQPGLAFDGSLIAQNRPGYQETINQFGQPTFAPTSGPVPQSTGAVKASGQFFSRPDQQTNIFSQLQPGYQQSVSGSLPSVEQSQNRNQSLPGSLGFGNRPGYVPSTVPPQRFVPGSSFNIPQSSYPGQVQLNDYNPDMITQIPVGQQQFGDRQTVNQQYPGPQFNYELGEIGNQQNALLPSSTVAPGFTQPSGSPTSSNLGYSGNNQYTIEGSSAYPQQFPGSQRFPEAIDNGQNVFPSSTAATVTNSGIPNQSYSSDAFGAPGQREQFPFTVNDGVNPTSIYPGDQSNTASVYRNRPERPQADGDRNAVILNYENVITPEGFAYSFDTSNGIHADESGTTGDGVKAKGSYSYTGDDGKLYSVVYTADEDGFRPRGDHLPTPPPVPEAIQRIIEQVEKEKEAGISHDGSYDEDKYGHKKYQGALSRRPQLTNKMSTTDTELYKDNVLQTSSQQTKDRFRPQTGKKRPTVTTQQSDYEDDLSVSGVTDEKQFANDGNRRQPGQITTQRPVSYVTDLDAEDNESDELGPFEGKLQSDQRPTNRPYIEVSSKRPTIRKQFNKISDPGFEESSIRQGNQRRPANRLPSNQDLKQDQDSGDYIEYNEPEGGDNRYVSKEFSRRPISKMSGKYKPDTLASNSYEEDYSSTLPTVTEDEEIGSQQIFDKYGRPINRTPVRRPILKNNKVANQPDFEDSYSKKSGGITRPFSTSSTYFPEASETVADDYSSDDDYVTKLPTKYRPDSVKTSNKFVHRDQNKPIGIRRRPTSSSNKLYGSSTTEKNIVYRPSNNEEYSVENSQSEDYDSRHPTLSSTVSEQGDQYEEINPETEEFVPIQGISSSKPKISTLSKYGGFRGRPQTKLQFTTDDVQEFEDKRLSSAAPGTGLSQKNSGPNFNQQTGYIKGYHNQPFNASGYQYIPPQNKFEEDGVKEFPTRLSGTTRRPFTGRPTPSAIYYKDTDKLSKPFMTPNVSAINDQGKYASRRPEITTSTQENENIFYNDNASQYPGSASTPDQDFGDDEISSTRPSNQFVSSTYRPIGQETTTRPQYNERVFQNGRPMSSQDSDNRYYKGTKTPYGIVSSTTPLPATRPYGSKIQTTRPGQHSDSFSTGDGSYKKVPGQGSVLSTTPLPSQSPTASELYQQSTNKPQYQTTYRPSGTIQPITDYEDGTTVQRLPSISYTEPSINITPGVSRDQYQGSLPSTTYRPGFITSSRNPQTSPNRPSSPVDRYGRPINVPGSVITDQEYLPESQYQPSSTTIPSDEVDAYGRPTTRPEVSTTIQEFTPGGQYQFSSTMRPNTGVDTYRRPNNQFEFGTKLPGGQKQPSVARPGFVGDVSRRPVNKAGSSITNQGYVPSRQNVSLAAARPGVLVDAFGRPTSDRIPEYGSQSQNLPSSTESPGFVDAYGRPVTTPGSNVRYTTGFTTPGSVDKGVIANGENKPLGQYQPEVISSNRVRGQQKYEQSTPSVGIQGYQPNSTSAPSSQFRGQQMYRPGVTGRPVGQGSTSQTFQPSTERVIGEDFSGPKQQQKFDPETGYYYK